MKDRECVVEDAELEISECKQVCVATLFEQFACPRSFDSMKDELYEQHKSFVANDRAPVNEIEFRWALDSLVSEESLSTLSAYVDRVVAARRKARKESK